MTPAILALFLFSDIQFWTAQPNGAIIEEIRAKSPHGVVEIGSGSGAWLETLEANGIDSIGFDIKPAGPLVMLGNHTASAAYPERSLLVIWPPDGTRLEEWLKPYAGNVVFLSCNPSRIVFPDFAALGFRKTRELAAEGVRGKFFSKFWTYERRGGP